MGTEQCVALAVGVFLLLLLAVLEQFRRFLKIRRDFTCLTQSFESLKVELNEAIARVNSEAMKYRQILNELVPIAGSEAVVDAIPTRPALIGMSVQLIALNGFERIHVVVRLATSDNRLLALPYCCTHHVSGKFDEQQDGFLTESLDLELSKSLCTLDRVLAHDIAGLAAVWIRATEIVVQRSKDDSN